MSRYTRRETLALGLIAAVTAWAAPWSALMGAGAARAQGAREVVEMTQGDADAPVTVIEYAMFTCPHCATFHAEVFPQLKANFIDTGKVRFVFREVYFNRPSLWAAMIARCAPEDRYFGIVELLFQNQDDWAGQSDPQVLVERLFAIGRQAGLTDADMQACLSDQAFAEALVAEFQTTSTADGVDATPTFVVNGTKTGNMGYAEFEAMLNEALG